MIGKLKEDINSIEDKDRGDYLNNKLDMLRMLSKSDVGMVHYGLFKIKGEIDMIKKSGV